MSGRGASRRHPPIPSPTQDAELIETATQVRIHAHAPYSKFRVGAAVRTQNGAIYSGANVENASYGLSICAERVAIHKAISEGHRRVVALAVVADGEALTMPCGACRQVMAEFGVRRVIVATPKGRTRTRTLKQLLADPFLPDRLPRFR